MKPFTYKEANNVDDAVETISTVSAAKFIGGGTNLVDLMRENIEQPDKVIDVTHLPLTEVEELNDGSIKIGALVRNSQLAANKIIRERFPVLSMAILNGASAQLRNMATTGGNIMQRTRCYYFYDETSRCNKRKPGSGCDAIDGYNRIHAILGTSEKCIATHPSDMCVAMSMLDAKIIVKGKNGEHEIAFTDFHKLPGDTPNIETVLQQDELITAVIIPSLLFAKNSLYRKVRDRASYAFALVSVAAALEVENNIVKNVRLALGGVAHKPWRAFKAENYLMNKQATEENFYAAAEEELENAKGFGDNNFKIELAKRTIVSVLKELV
ncbi:MAG TPA: xanthine dehydrogenase family protein subunit M [Parafilimonas sp.]